jgi:hypothetical protein
MPDPLSAAERYRSDAAKFFDLAKDAPNPFIRDYYHRLAKRYLMHAENQEKIARVSEGSAATEAIQDSPSVQAAPETASSSEVSASDQSASPAPLQPEQGPVGAPRQSRRRRPARAASGPNPGAKERGSRSADASEPPVVSGAPARKRIPAGRKPDGGPEQSND